MTSIQIRLSFLLLLLHVSVFAAPVSLHSSSDNVGPSVDLPFKGATQDRHAKRQSGTNPVPPLNEKIDLCITTDGITRSSSNVGNSAQDTPGVSSSLANALHCDSTGPNTQGTLTHTVGLANSQNLLSAIETSIGQFPGGASTGTIPTSSLPGSLVSGISATNPANVNPGSVSSHSVHVTSGGGSDGSMGNTEVRLPPLNGLLAIGFGGITTSGFRPLGQLGSAVGVPSGGTIPSTVTGPILANGALSAVNSEILGGRVGSGVPGSVKSLDVASGGGSQGSLGSMKVESPVFGSALAIGTGSNGHSGIPAVSEGGQSGSPTHDNSPKPNGDPSSKNSNGTPKGQNDSGHHGQPNNNTPADSSADQNSGTKGRAAPASNTGQNRPPSSPPPNRGSAPNANNSPSNGPNSTPSDGNRAPVGTTNQGGNIAELNVGVPANGQYFGANGLVRQRNM